MRGEYDERMLIMGGRRPCGDGDGQQPHLDLGVSAKVRRVVIQRSAAVLRIKMTTLKRGEKGERSTEAGDVRRAACESVPALGYCTCSSSSAVGGRTYAQGHVVAGDNRKGWAAMPGSVSIAAGRRPTGAHMYIQYEVDGLEELEIGRGRWRMRAVSRG